jgi:hypothetical protein
MARTDEERDIVRTERDAFESFLDRLRDIQADGWNASETTHGHTALTTVDKAPQTGFQEIRRAYRETVMGVAHYDREYGDTLRESLAAEVGEPLARRVADGQILMPAVHDALVEATRQTRDDRDEFLARLRRERESLRTIADELNDTEARVVELADRIDATDKSADLSRIDGTLRLLERRCTDLVSRRQQRVHNRGNRDLSGFASGSLSQYLYGDMETVTPAIADAGSCLETIRYERARCLR